MADTITGLPSALHDLVELEAGSAYARGYEAGRADTEAEIQATAERIAGSPHPPYLSPTAEQIVRDLAARLTAQARPLNTPPPGNHPGGPVPAWEATG